jgi:transposase
VQRFVKHWKSAQKMTPAATKPFIPLAFPPGETCQFDWSEELVELVGLVSKIKVGHFRLCYSRKMVVVAYPCETREMVLDAHNKAFVFFGGVPLRMVYDNPKTIVDPVFVGKERKFNRRFLTLATHYLFAPVACTLSELVGRRARLRISLVMCANGYLPREPGWLILMN